MHSQPSHDTHFRKGRSMKNKKRKSPFFYIVQQTIFKQLFITQVNESFRLAIPLFVLLSILYIIKNVN